MLLSCPAERLRRWGQADSAGFGMGWGFGWGRQGRGQGEFWLTSIGLYSWALLLLGTEGMNEEEGGEEMKG